MASAPPVAIRAMSPDDVAAVVAIEAEAFTSPWKEDTFLALLDRDAVELVVLVDGDDVIGYAVVWCILDQGELSNIAVAASHRGRGLGRKLLAHAIEVARRRGVAHLFLEVRVSNRAARELYGSAGFVELGRRRNYYDQPREDAILMQFAMVAGSAGTG